MSQTIKIVINQQGSLNMKKIGLLLLITLFMAGCSATAERIREGRDLDYLNAKYAYRYIVVSSKPASKLFDDVNLTCKVEAQAHADQVIAEGRRMQLKELEGRSGHEKTMLMSIYKSGEGMRKPLIVKNGYHNCMNKSGWDTRRVCVRNCSDEARRLYDLKRAEYKARYP